MFRGPVLTDDDDVDQGCQVFVKVHRAGRVWPMGRMFDTPDVDDFVADTISCLYIYIYIYLFCEMSVHADGVVFAHCVIERRS